MSDDVLDARQKPSAWQLRVEPTTCGTKLGLAPDAVAFLVGEGETSLPNQP